MQLEDHSRPAEPTPLWLLFIAGLLAGSAARASLGRPGEAKASGAGPPAARPDLSRLSARELRRLPGIGAKLAVSLVEARWQRAPGDPPLLLEDVAGIGPGVEGRVRAWLQAQAEAGEPSALGRR